MRIGVFQNAGSYSSDQLASAFFINSSGELYATGNNTYGELGVGEYLTAFSAPQQVRRALTTVVKSCLWEKPYYRSENRWNLMGMGEK